MSSLPQYLCVPAMPTLRVIINQKKRAMGGLSAKHTPLAMAEVDLEDLGEKIEQQGANLV